MRVLDILPLCVALSAPYNSAGQTKATKPLKSVTIEDNHGKITIDEITYNDTYKNAVLNVDKYIDTSKAIEVVFGNNTINNYPLSFLKQEEVPVLLHLWATGPSIDGLNILRIRVKNGHLFLSGDVNSFDQKYICRIRDNVLIEAKQYHLYASDRYFELFDDYYIPVLQIELIKEKNQINIGGAFPLKQGYMVAGKNLGLIDVGYSKPILLMRQSERDSAFNEYLTCAKRIKPIHEE